MLGNFSAEKELVRSEMRQRLAALKEDRVPSRPEKELIVVTAVCSVFRYSAGIVDWTKTELDDITKIMDFSLQAGVDSPSRLRRIPYDPGEI